MSRIATLAVRGRGQYRPVLGRILLPGKGRGNGTPLALGRARNTALFREDTVSARNLVFSSAFLLHLLPATTAAAQRVAADIRIGDGPVCGRVIIGERYRYVYLHLP